MATLETRLGAFLAAVAADIKTIFTELRTSTKTIYINPTTGQWPNAGARTVPAGYTGIVIWHGLNVYNPPAPSGSIDGDIWIRRMP